MQSQFNRKHIWLLAYPATVLVFLCIYAVHTQGSNTHPWLNFPIPLGQGASILRLLAFTLLATANYFLLGDGDSKPSENAAVLTVIIIGSIVIAIMIELLVWILFQAVR